MISESKLRNEKRLPEMATDVTVFSRPEKTTLGVPLYGRSFLLVDPAKSGMGAAARGSSFAGPITREEGFLGYNEICTMLGPGSNWSVEWEPCHQAPFMVNQNKWVSFDNARSVGLKADLAWDTGLAGVMVWSIETDDFKGACGGEQFPLLRTLNSALANRAQGGEPGEHSNCDPDHYNTERPDAVLPTFPATQPDLSDGEPKAEPEPEPEAEPGSPAPSSAPAPAGPCPNLNGPNPNPSNCEQFYLCAGGVPHLMTCRPGTRYSAALMTCDHAGNVVCEETPASAPAPAPVPEPTPTVTLRPVKPFKPVIDDNRVDTKYNPAEENTGSEAAAGPVDISSGAELPQPPNNIPSNSLDTGRLESFHTHYPAPAPAPSPVPAAEPLPEQGGGVTGETVVLVLLVLLLLAVLALSLWCFRGRVAEAAEPWLSRISLQRMRKPSTVSLLRAYKLNKVRFPGVKEEGEAAPPLPARPAPPSYRTRDLPPIPGQEGGDHAPTAPPRRKKSISENIYDSPLSPA